MDALISQTSNLGFLVAGLCNSDHEIIRRSLTDHIVEPQRKKYIPHCDTIKEIALSNNALGFSISGAGPSMFALCADLAVAECIASLTKQFYHDHKLDVNVFVSGINKTGAYKY